MTPLATEQRVLLITAAQNRVLRELCHDGAENSEIAQRLGVVEDTVKSHIRGLLRAGGYANRTALVVDLLRGRSRVKLVRRAANKQEEV